MADATMVNQTLHHDVFIRESKLWYEFLPLAEVPPEALEAASAQKEVLQRV